MTPVFDFRNEDVVKAYQQFGALVRDILNQTRVTRQASLPSQVDTKDAPRDPISG